MRYKWPLSRYCLFFFFIKKRKKNLVPIYEYMMNCDVFIFDGQWIFNLKSENQNPKIIGLCFTAVCCQRQSDGCSAVKKIMNKRTTHLNTDKSADKQPPWRHEGQKSPLSRSKLNCHHILGRVPADWKRLMVKHQTDFWLHSVQCSSATIVPGSQVENKGKKANGEMRG